MAFNICVRTRVCIFRPETPRAYRDIGWIDDCFNALCGWFARADRRAHAHCKPYLRSFLFRGTVSTRSACGTPFHTFIDGKAFDIRTRRRCIRGCPRLTSTPAPVASPICAALHFVQRVRRDRLVQRRFTRSLMGKRFTIAQGAAAFGAVRA